MHTNSKENTYRLREDRTNHLLAQILLSTASYMYSDIYTCTVAITLEL